jgi:hypothetical protein
MPPEHELPEGQQVPPVPQQKLVHPMHDLGGLPQYFVQFTQAPP